MVLRQGGITLTPRGYYIKDKNSINNPSNYYYIEELIKKEKQEK